MNSPTTKHDSLPENYRDLCFEVYLPQPIHDGAGYENARDVMHMLLRRDDLTHGQIEYLKAVTRYVKEYEDETCDFDTSGVTPLEALEYLMEANDMDAADLVPLIGDKSTVYKILTGKRDLSKAQIVKLAARFKVSTDLFMPSAP